MQLVRDNELEKRLKELMAVLEPHHPKDAELHQLYLESQWLLSNQSAGQISLPTDWELIIFKLIDSDKLKSLPDARRPAVQIVQMIKRIAHCGDRVAL